LETKKTFPWIRVINRRFLGYEMKDVFCRSVPTLYKRSHGSDQIRSEQKFHVEAGSNTSTIALRDVGGDEKGTQCLRV
jgi:hypothetical protein